MAERTIQPIEDRQSKGNTVSHATSNLVKNIIIAATLGLAAFASWAMTDFREPTIEAAISQTANS